MVPAVLATPLARTPAAAPVNHAAVRPKTKLTRPPRVPVTTEEVYAFIEATLAHTETKVATKPFPVDRARVDGGRVEANAAPGAAQSGAAAANPRAAVPTQTHGVTLGTAVKWVWRHLHRRPRA